MDFISSSEVENIFHEWQIHEWNTHIFHFTSELITSELKDIFNKKI